MTLLVGLPRHSVRTHWETRSLQPKPLVDNGCSFQGLQSLKDWDCSKLPRGRLSAAGPLATEEDGTVAGCRISGFKSCLHHL